MTEIKLFHKLTDDERMIRTKVFIEEQHFNEEFDSLDSKCSHLVIYEDGKAAGCVRFFSGENEDEYHVGRLAVLKDFRGKHYGEMLVREAERCIKLLGAKSIVLSAQVRVSKFYEKLGYIKSGEIYFDEYCEHINMKKNLKYDAINA